jgi:hypothetical protein
MSQRIRPSLQEYGVAVVDPPFDAPDILRAPPAPKSVTPPVTPSADRSRLGVVLVLVGLGLLMQGGADALARIGHGSPALPLFLFGIALDFAACAWRLTSEHATRKERLWVSVVLGLGLFASYAMLHPLLLDSFDELAHLGTLTRLLNSHALFPRNSILPVSPYYPGLELATAATRWLTGLPLVVDQLIVLSAVRVVLVLAVFLVVERACHSSRAGGIGVLVYAASPQFYGFDAQYAYETIALAFAVAVVYLLFVSIDTARPKIGRSFALALGCVGAVVLSHHVTGWLTVGFLVAWAVGLYLTARPRRHLTLTGWGPALPQFAAPTARVSAEPPLVGDQRKAQASSVPGSELYSKRMIQARIVGIAAAVGLIVGGAWTLFVGRLLAPYLGPVFAAASADLAEALGNGHGNRALFKSAAGGGSPHWEIALILVSAVGWCIILVPSLFSVIFKRTVRGGALRYLPAVIAAAYPISVLANVSSGSKLVAERATTFIFFGVALVVGAWLARRISRSRRMIERVATLGVATVMFLGSLLFGIGPLVSLLPGPYHVGADQLSYGSPSLAVAHWADTHLPAGSHVATDKDNGVLLNAIGGVVSATAEGGLVNPELLFFDRRLSLYDIYLIRTADIRYIVVDDRLAQGPPLYGTYIADGEPSTRLTLAELNKFNSYPFIKRIYDNGPIQVYDVTGLLHPSPRSAPAGPPVGGTGLDVGVFLLAAVVAVLWLLRLRRRPGRGHNGEHLVICGVVGALVIGVFGAFLIRLTHLPPETIAIVVLLVLLGLGLRPESWQRRHVTDGDAAVMDDLNARSLPMETSMKLSGIPYQVAAGSKLYERREIKDVLAYARALADPGDDVSVQRIVNIPRRGIGGKSASRLASWARFNNAFFSEAIDHAAEAGLNGKALLGAQQLSTLLAELRPLMHTMSPADFVELVADRTGYKAELVAEHTHEADGRIENLADLAAQAGNFDDLTGFLQAAALAAESGGLDRPVGSPRQADRSDLVSSTPPPRPTRRSRSQVLLGSLGLALFALGATLATVASLNEWTPPPQLSVATSPAGRSVAEVELGSAGPVAATLEVRTGGHAVWRSSLAQTTAAQRVGLPTGLLRKGSRVVLVIGGHGLRVIDG